MHGNRTQIFLLSSSPAFAIQMTIFLVAISSIPIACNSLPFSSLINATLHFSGDTVARLCADDRGSGFDTWQGLETLLFSIASRPVPAPTQPPIKWVPTGIPPAYSGRGVNLTDVWISGPVFDEA